MECIWWKGVRSAGYGRWGYVGVYEYFGLHRYNIRNTIDILINILIN